MSVLAPATAARSAVVPHAAVAGTIDVGTLTLERCDVLDGAYCGTLRRPWDPTGAVPGTFDVGFAYVPANDQTRPALGTVVPHEGGPGYSTTGTADSYAAMYGALLERRNLLLVDQRGTGLTAPIDCPALQDGLLEYGRAAAACAKSLGGRAHLYGSALSADDLGAVVVALGLGRVDVYGDSYGTFFAQVFAGRHPEQVRTLVLDSAYPTYGEDAWYETQSLAMRQSFNRVCTRTAACRALGYTTTARLTALVEDVRARPIVGRARGGDGKLHSLTLDAPAMVYLAFNATYGPATYRELDAAIRAWFWYRDRAPLLRLLAEAYYPGGGTSDPVDYSEGLYAAVSCSDYPQLYDLRDPVATRRQQYAAAIRERITRRPTTYAPFTVREYLASDWQSQSMCLTWPAAPAPYRQGPVVPPGGRYPAVPVLVLAGELDSITTPAEGAIVARQWPRSQRVVVANSFHVTALGDTDGCAARILRSFVSAGRLPGVSGTGCASAVPPVRGTPAFRRSTADAPPARAEDGSTRSRVRLSTVRTTVETVADVLDRWYQTAEVGGRGLRGGSWVSDGYDVVTFELSRYRLVQDLAVSGSVTWDRYAHTVTVDLRVHGTRADGSNVMGSPTTGRLRGSWDTRAAGAEATLRGALGGRPVHATLTAA